MKPEDASLNHPVDALVRAYLDRQADRIDPAPAVQRIATTLGSTQALRAKPTLRLRLRLSNRWVVGSAIAAAAVLLLTVGVFTWPARPVAAESIVRQAKAVHASPLDRCYRVETDLEFTPIEGGDPASIVRPRQIRLWTRGDRFWIESEIGLRQINWGRDESGGLWLAFAPHRGLRFEPAELPPAIALRCDVLSVRLETLLGEVLTDCDLKTDPDDPKVIRATPKPGRRRILREAVLEVDPETKVLKRLELTRTIAGRTITTRFHLEATRKLDDSQYQLEGHLKSPYLINAHELDPKRRRQILLRLFGNR